MDGRQGPGHPGSFSQTRGLDLTYEQTGMHWGNFRLSQGILYFWFEKLHFATVWSVYSGAGSRSRKEGWGDTGRPTWLGGVMSAFSVQGLVPALDLHFLWSS